MVGKMIKIKYLISIQICLLLFSQAYASGDEGQAGAFLRYGVGGRALGMGRAYVAAANDASAVYWNPAGIVGATRPEFASMYTNLYYDSQYAYMGVVYPRIVPNTRNGLLQFLFGKWSALGLAWTGLASTDYDQMSDVGEHLGQFEIQENAFYLSWARETIGSYGVLKYGLNFKLINQSFPGLINTEALQTDLMNRDWTAGLDVGMQFQPIHAPVFKLVSLRYLLPLQLGVNLQNLIPPGYDSLDGSSVHFPFVMRWGYRYQFNLSDWIPSSWYWMYDVFSKSALVTTMDWEVVDGGSAGHYWGVEGIHPIRESRTYLYWRAGLNNRTEGPSFGAGLCMPFTNAAQLQLDYAYGVHPYLPEDSRFFMTVKFGPQYGSRYFLDESKNYDAKDPAWEDYLLKSLSEYPNPDIRESVELLASECDSSLIPRYFDLIGGLGRAEWLMRDARLLLKLGKIKQARKKASQAADEYYNAYKPAEDNLSDRHLFNYGEALVLTESYADAVKILNRIKKPDLKSSYLVATSYKKMGRWEDAIAGFNQITKMKDEIDLESIVPLAFLGWGESLMGIGSFESAISTFTLLLNRYTGTLDENYPRYPIVVDNYIQDDAQYLIGLSQVQLGHFEEGMLEILKDVRYYPDLEYGRVVSNHMQVMLEMLTNKSWNQLSSFVNQLYAEYLIAH